jgi:transposase-like protein
VIDILVQPRRDRDAAERFLRKLLKGCQVARVGSQSFSPDRGPDLTSSACQTPGFVRGREGPHW